MYSDSARISATSLCENVKINQKYQNQKYQNQKLRLKKLKIKKKLIRKTDRKFEIRNSYEGCGYSLIGDWRIDSSQLAAYRVGSGVVRSPCSIHYERGWIAGKP